MSAEADRRRTGRSGHTFAGVNNVYRTTAGLADRRPRQSRDAESRYNTLLNMPLWRFRHRSGHDRLQRRRRYQVIANSTRKIDWSPERMLSIQFPHVQRFTVVPLGAFLCASRPYGRTADHQPIDQLPAVTISYNLRKACRLAIR